MVDLVVSLPVLVGAVLAMAVMAALGLAVYGISYKLISRYQSDELKDPTSNLFRVVGMLLSLMLSLAFAEVIVERRAIDAAIGREAAAIRDLFFDLHAFDPETTRETRARLIEYADAVIRDEWPALAGDQLGQRTTAVKRQLMSQVLSLRADSQLQEMLWSRMQADIEALSRHRLVRLDGALGQPPVFVFVVVFGFVLTMACFGAYRPQKPLLALIALYTLFIGFVLFMILSLSDPYRGAFSVSPDALEHVVEKLRAENA